MEGPKDPTLLRWLTLRISIETTHWALHNDQIESAGSNLWVFGLLAWKVMERPDDFDNGIVDPEYRRAVGTLSKPCRQPGTNLWGTGTGKFCELVLELLAVICYPNGCFTAWMPTLGTPNDGRKLKPESTSGRR